MARSAILAAPSSRARRLAWPALLGLAVVAVIAVGGLSDRLQRAGEPRGLDPATIHAGYGPSSFAESRALAERNLAAARLTYATAPDEWLRTESLARALIARWRLDNDYADLAEAGRLLDDGLARAPYPSGPVLSRALLSLTVHRLGDAEAALERFARFVAPDSADVADAAALRGDLALQRGDLGRAAADYAEAERVGRTAGTSVRSATLRAYRGDRGGAAAALEALIAKPRQQPALLAELMLQRANLAYWAGEWAEAGRWVGAAQRTYPGYWLADAYAAQQFALAGRSAEAIRAYTRVAKRSGRPEVMDALAHLLRLEGRGRESRAWAARAERGWAQRGALFPEAVAHHRAEHELAVGSAARALEYAGADATARSQAPNLVLLARAELIAGHPQAARALLVRAARQGWASAALWTARSEVEAALGHAEASAAARSNAEALNPRAFDPRARLVWFGHD